jgi:hypothetical protein
MLACALTHCVPLCRVAGRGQATTLKRNGSDFSATILGSMFRSSYITIWTDVDGVYSADPRKVREGRGAGRGAAGKLAWWFGGVCGHPDGTPPWRSCVGSF